MTSTECPMKAKPSVTFNVSRKVTLKWKDKLDPEGLVYLNAYRIAQQDVGPAPTLVKDLMPWLERITLAAASLPEDACASELRTVMLDKKFVDFLEIEGSPFAGSFTEGENMVPPGYAEILRVFQPCVLEFESDPNKRLMGYFFAGFMFRLICPMMERLRFDRFGNEPMDFDKTRILAAMAMEFGANVLRGHWKPPKGKIDGELVDLVNRIPKYTLTPMSPSELWHAVTYAGTLLSGYGSGQRL